MSLQAMSEPKPSSTTTAIESNSGGSSSGGSNKRKRDETEEDGLAIEVDRYGVIYLDCTPSPSDSKSSLQPLSSPTTHTHPPSSLLLNLN